MSPRRKNSRRDERSIVVLSNRLPFTVQRGPKGLETRRSPGGLVSALEPVLRKRGGTWVGWPGTEVRPGELLAPSGEPYRVVPLQLSETEVTRYYHGFSNRTLWPLLHSLPGRARFEHREWETYQRVNARFAEAALDESEANDLIWVHDYHLMLAPDLIRGARPEARVAFFLHIPFPPYDIFRLMPWDRELLRGMLGSDLIGFHTRGYAENFLDCVERRLAARVDSRRMAVEYGDRTSQVGYFPLGIEFDRFEACARSAARPKNAARERIVLGVDRLDYTKGLPERIRAFERLLELYPEHRERVVLLQLAVPSRSQVAEYRQLKRDIDEVVGRVNGRFSTASWSPIRYLYQSMSQERLAGLYRDADVALVTPLRDGMNLVAKEFAAAQVDDPGVLVLSRLAGAADTMHEALLVNPYNIDETAEAIHRALTMDEAERASRVAALRRREKRYDLDAWVRTFLQAASGPSASLSPITPDELNRWLEGFLARRALALFVDYDGTLTALREHPSQAVLSTGMRAGLRACAARSDTDVAVVSGRALSDIRRIVGESGLTYAGNHGLEISGPDFDEFGHEDLVHYRERTEALAKALEAVAVDGAWIEAKGPTLTYHYRAVTEARRPDLAREARSIIERGGYQARDAHCAVEARPPIGWDKGRAVLHILRARYGPSWSESVRVIYIGDDVTDEDAFRFLAGLAMTFRVGAADKLTAARRRLPNVGSVETLLEWLACRAPARP